MDFDVFKNRVSMSKEDMYRDFFRENRDRIKIKKAPVAIKNLIKISEATLALSNKKGFSAIVTNCFILFIRNHQVTVTIWTSHWYELNRFFGRGIVKIRHSTSPT